MTDEVPETGFSAEYVKQLREENAKWRKQVRDLEGKQTYQEVALEFAKRGITADPSWLNIPEGVTPAEAVEQFLSTFQVGAPEEGVEEEPRRPAPPQALPPNGVSPHTPGPPAQGAFGGRSLDEIKADPKARAALRDQYRQLLHGNTPEQYNS